MLIPKTTIKRRFLLKRSKDTLARNRDKECFPFTLSLSPLQLFIWHTHTVNRFPSSKPGSHDTPSDDFFTSLFFWFVSFITQEQIKKGWKWDSHRDRHFTTLMRPLFRLKTDLCVRLMDLNFSHHFFASARCLNGTSPPHHRQNSKVYLIFRLACFSIENNTSTLIRIGLETRNNVHGN